MWLKDLQNVNNNFLKALTINDLHARGARKRNYIINNNLCQY